MKNLTFYLGHNGTDKSNKILTAVKEHVKNARSNMEIFVIVPDQYTFTAEKFYMDQLGEKLLYHIHILSFKRLINLYSNEKQNQIGSGGRSALVWRAYTNVREDMRYYKKTNDIHFITALCEQIDELKLYGISPEKLSDMKIKNEKLEDLARIYHMYNALLGIDRPDPADEFYRFAQDIQDRHLFQDKYIFVDFFKVLNAAEIAVLQGILKSGGNVSVGLMCTTMDKEMNHLSPVYAIFKRLLKFAEINSITTQTFVTDKSVYANKDILDLEKNLFSHIPNPITHKSDALEFYRAADLRDELDYIACNIKRMVRDNHCKFEDFALVTRNTEKYEAYIEIIFSEYDIPIFRHKKTAIRQKPPVKFLYALYCTIKNNLNQQDVLDLVKTGYLPDIDEHTIALFEKYVTMWNIRFSKFIRPFTRSIKGFSSMQDTDEDLQELKKINTVRETIINFVDIFGKSSQKDTVRNFCTKTYQIFKLTNIESKLTQSSQLYENYGRRDLYQENLQVYALLIQALDEFVEVCGDEQITTIQFFDQFFAVLDSYDIGILPTAIDTVLLGNADTVPLFRQKYIFVFGLTESEFPAVNSENGLIGEKDRKLMLENGLTIGREPYETYLYEQFIVYFCMTSATNKVFLSYPSISGGENQPSTAFESARNIFPEQPLLAPPSLSNTNSIIQRMQAQLPAFELLTKLGIKPADNIFEKMIKYTIRPHNEKNFLKPEIAERLYGKNLTLSATSSDKYYKCPYYYFYQNGLGIRKPESARLSAVNTGKLIHSVLENIFSTYGQLDFDDKTLYHFADQYTKAYMESIYPIHEMGAGLSTYLSNLVRKIWRLLKIMREELQQSEFTPRYFELQIGKDIPAAIFTFSGCKIRISGAVDRIDIYEKDNKSYLRIIDYKSGKKEFNIDNIRCGIDIQMLLYLYVLCSKEKNITPAGVLYTNANPRPILLEKDKVYLATSRGKENLAALENIPDRSGLLLNDKDILKKMDKTYVADDIKKAKFLPKSLKLASNAEFFELFEHIAGLLKLMGKRLSNGDITRTAKKFGTKSGCEFCDLQDMCETAQTPCPAPQYENLTEILKHEQKN